MHNKVNKNTKIVATVGPACSSLENLRALADAGVNIFRLNFSHSRHNEHLEVIQRITELNEKFGEKRTEGFYVEHDLTQEELAQLVGASRETVNKALADFVQREWIKLEPRAVLILDVERLSRRAR